MKIYLAGYTGRKPEQFEQLSNLLDAIIVDIRLSPLSRVAHWDNSALKARFRDRYTWIQDLGNENYKNGGPIKIRNLDRGIGRVVALPWSATILICACPNAHSCHRTVVGHGFTAKGHDVEEIDWGILAGKPKKEVAWQSSLF